MITSDKLIEAKDENVIKHNEQTQYKAIDLGIRVNGKKVYFADRNIGASSPEDYGDYFMCGSVTPDTYNVCDWEHAPFNNGSENFNEGYFNKHKSDCLDRNDVLKPEYDAATQIMGEGWSIPTEEIWQALIDGTTSECTTINDINGRRFTGKGDYVNKSIFVPAAGFRDGDSSTIQGIFGCIWSSSLDSDDHDHECYLFFDSYDTFVSTDDRRFGYSVRGVFIES